MSLHQTYLKNATELIHVAKFSGTRSKGWRSPSNIALIKYWGKKENQTPQNPSLSFTLSKSFTETTVEYAWKPGDILKSDFVFEGNTNIPFARKVNNYLLTISK